MDECDASVSATDASPPPAARDVDALLSALRDARGHDARSKLRNDVRAWGAAATPALLRCLDADDCFLRWEAVNLIGELADPLALDRVVELALSEDEVHARWRSFWAVSRFDTRRTVPMLLEALGGPDPARWRAALVLSMLGRRECGAVLLTGLESPETWIQWEALGALKAIALPGTEDAIAPFTERTRDRSLRQEAVLALGALRSDAAIDLLLPLLDDPEPEVRWRVSMVLSRCRRADVVKHMSERLAHEEHPGVRDQLRADLHRMEVGDARTR